MLRRVTARFLVFGGFFVLRYLCHRDRMAIYVVGRAAAAPTQMYSFIEMNHFRLLSKEKRFLQKAEGEKKDMEHKSSLSVTAGNCL